MNLFLSYNHSQAASFVRLVKKWLATQPAIEACYFSPESPMPGSYWETLAANLNSCNGFVAFLTESMGETQKQEILFIKERAVNLARLANTSPPGIFVLFVLLAADIPPEAHLIRQGYTVIEVSPEIPRVAREPSSPHEDVPVNRDLDRAARHNARDIIDGLGLPWVDPDGVPEGYLWSYEKDIIAKYRRASSEELEDQGLPAKWPDVERQDANISNPLELKVIGNHRPDSARVLVDTRFRDDDEDVIALDPSLSFPEAGPRERVAFPKNGSLTVGILVSGGIAPGINAVIGSIITRHNQYRNACRRKNPNDDYDLRTFGYVEGFKSLLSGGPDRIDLKGVDTHSHEGGSILGTSREEDLVGHDSVAVRAMQRLVERFIHDGLDILYIIGGDGSMRAARAISTVAKAQAPRDAWSPFTVVGIPKTMDNDILWAWQSFGFISAVEHAKAVVRALHTEAKSNPRLGVIQLFGTSSGFVASHTALGSGVCDAVLIPEVPFTLAELSRHVCNLLRRRRRPGPSGTSPHGIVLMSEAAVPTDWRSYLDNPDYPNLQLSEEEREALKKFEEQRRRIIGQTPDALRSAALKLVSVVLMHDIRRIRGSADYWSRFRVFANEPRHIVRAVEPSVADIILAQRLGTLAVDGAMAGYMSFMVSQWLTEYVFVPLELVVLGRKRVPQQGIFWKTVVASTGQPEP
jgi:6-phosphofructokinase 1